MADNSISCPRCGTALGAGARFCASCGASTSRLVPGQILDGLRMHHAAGADHVGIQVIGEPGETPIAGFRQLAEQLSAEAAR